MRHFLILISLIFSTNCFSQFYVVKCDDTLHEKTKATSSFNIPPLKRAKLSIKIEALYYNQVELSDPLNGNSIYFFKLYNEGTKVFEYLTDFNYSGKDVLFKVNTLHIDAGLADKWKADRNKFCKMASHVSNAGKPLQVETLEGVDKFYIGYSDIRGRRNEAYKNVQVSIIIF